MNAQVKALIKTSNFHIRALRHVRRGQSQIYQDDRFRSHHFSARLLQLTSVRHFKVEYQQTPLYSEWSCASCASSSIEFQLKTVAQTATLASSPAEDNIRDRSIVTFNMQSYEQPSYLQSAGQLHTFTEP